jgi:hypothetical protein
VESYLSNSSCKHSLVLNILVVPWRKAGVVENVSEALNGLRLHGGEKSMRAGASWCCSAE